MRLMLPWLTCDLTKTPTRASRGARSSVYCPLPETRAPASRSSGVWAVPDLSIILNFPKRPAARTEAESLPLDRAGRFARYVIDDAVDAAHLVDDAGGGAAEEIHVEM